MRILVTGGAGFIGTNLVHKLRLEGHELVVVDDFSTGSVQNMLPIYEGSTAKQFRYNVLDVTQPWADYGAFDQIYHLACPASPVAYQVDPRKTWKTATIGTLRALEYAEHCGATLLVSSTSEVYGDPNVHPQAESYHGNVNFTGPRACYDEGKRAAETLLADAERAGSRVRVARIFNTYGPFMAVDDGRVVSNFIVQALRGEKLTIYGDGSQTRSLCYVQDLVKGLVKLMNSELTLPVNLGNPQEITMAHLAREVSRLVGSELAVIFKPLPADDPRQRCPDIDTAIDFLNWRPEIELEQGLTRTITYFKEKLT